MAETSTTWKSLAAGYVAGAVTVGAFFLSWMFGAFVLGASGIYVLWKRRA